MINTPTADQPAGHVVDHRWEADRFIAKAYERYAAGNQPGRPDAERAEAVQACRLVTGLAFAHGLLAIADAIGRQAPPHTVDEHGSAEAGEEPPAETARRLRHQITDLIDQNRRVLRERNEARRSLTVDRQVSVAAHLELMAERYPAAVFTLDGRAPDAIAGTALRTVLLTEAARLREEAS